MWIGKDSEGSIMTEWRYCHGICLKGLRKTTKNLSAYTRHTRYPDRDSNQALSQYESRSLPLCQLFQSENIWIVWKNVICITIMGNCYMNDTCWQPQPHLWDTAATHRSQTAAPHSWKLTIFHFVQCIHRLHYIEFDTEVKNVILRIVNTRIY
jgi:hypothetical protein